MDPHVFDRLTRLFSAPRSRRGAWRALLGGALLGATPRPAMASPCAKGKHMCGERKECCPGRCFVDECNPDTALCCTAPRLIICTDVITGKAVCCENQGDSPCDACLRPPDGPACPSSITGSYRRR